MPYSDFFKTHPPRCLAGFAAEPVDAPEIESDGHAAFSDLNLDEYEGVSISAPEYARPVFAVACRCGSRRHYVHGYVWTNPDFNNAVVFLSPVDLECADCGRRSNLLDTDVHGYDAELGHGSATVRGQGECTVFTCAKCGRQPLEILVKLEYPDDLFDEDDEEFAGREQELFTWISLFGKCPGCSELLAIADFECA